MQLGVNQNIKFKGEIFHIQTEDGGVNNPVITTLLFKGGSILNSRRTNYEDILKSENLPTVVKELMAEQHKYVLKELRSGNYKDSGGGSAMPPMPDEEEGLSEEDRLLAQVEAEAEARDAAEEAAAEADVVITPENIPEISPEPIIEAATATDPKKKPAAGDQEKSLEDIILEHLSLDD